VSILGTTKKSQQDKFNDAKKCHQLWMEWSHELSKGGGAHFLLERSCDPIRSPLMTLFVLLHLSHQDLSDDTDDVTIGVLVGLFLSFLSLFFFPPPSNLWREMREREKSMKKETNLWGAPKLWWWHHMYHKKYLDERNSTTPEKVTNADQSGPHNPSKGKWALPPLDGSYGPLYSSLVTFLSFIGFVLSKSFWQYQWCRHRSFGVLLRSFSFFLSLSSLFVVNSARPFYNLRELLITLTTHKSQISSATL